jgi:hypothetical protein
MFVAAPRAKKSRDAETASRQASLGDSEVSVSGVTASAG